MRRYHCDSVEELLWKLRAGQSIINFFWVQECHK